MWNRKCPRVVLISFVCPGTSLKINLLGGEKKKDSFCCCAVRNDVDQSPPVNTMLSGLSERLWADWIWFPEGYGWADLTDHDGKVFPKVQDLSAALPMALCFLVVRQLFER